MKSKVRKLFFHSVAFDTTRRNTFLISIILLIPISSLAEIEGWRKWLTPELRGLEQKRTVAQQQLSALGIPPVGSTTAQLGHQHPRTSSPPLAAPWVQVDLGALQKIDSIVLVPALVEQSTDRPAYGFPARFRVDLSDDAQFKKFFAAGVFIEEDFPNPGVAPVIIHVGGKMARYIRLTVTKLAEENHQYFFALSELMVLSGNLNVALGRPVKASAAVEIPPRWSAANLVDGRTPLGPPIKREFLDWDGLYAGNVGPSSNSISPSMELDLGSVVSIQQVRLHPMHARFGADIPGFLFPKSFRVEVSHTPDFADAVTLLDAQDFVNPGNNPVTISATNIEARYLKMTAWEKNSQGDLRFGLSEIEVYSGGKIVARGTAVTRTADTFTRSAAWPSSLLVDGFTSYGRLMELPDWLASWERRSELQAELQRLGQEEITLAAWAQRRVVWFGSGLGLAIVFGVFGFVIFTRHKRERELHDLRKMLEASSLG